ncbi:MAG: hypothetical protein ABW122_01795 [Ilumatobacteraceae bacterium]
MKLLLLYLTGALVLGILATRRGRMPRAWPLVAGAFVVAAAYYSQRML